MLSKSKLVAYRQCEKRMWLEIHRSELRVDSTSAKASFGVGNQVGSLARKLYDPDGTGTFIDLKALGFARAFEETRKALAANRIVFEAGFSHGGALSFADVMLPTPEGWRMVEVKSATEVKSYYHDDAAIQRWIAERSGVRIASVSVAHVDSGFVYPGGGRYAGLLKEEDLSRETAKRSEEIGEWIANASAVARSATEPAKEVGAHCTAPNRCGFFGYCNGNAQAAEFPVEWLPSHGKSLKEYVARLNAKDMREVPDALLTSRQLRVKRQTLSNIEWLDPAVSARLPRTDDPHYFLDFETIGFGVPIWEGTRPYEAIPFQFSLHVLRADGQVTAGGFLDLSGEHPARAFAEALVEQCGGNGPIFVYKAGTEGGQVRRLAEQFPDLQQALDAIHARLFDLLPLARAHYYHPSMHGKWSIKSVLPALAPELDYANLEGVQDGGMAQQAYLEAISPDTNKDRKAAIEVSLKTYCERDTWAMVVVWRKFAGRQHPALHRSTDA